MARAVGARTPGQAIREDSDAPAGRRRSATGVGVMLLALVIVVALVVELELLESPDGSQEHLVEGGDTQPDPSEEVGPTPPAVEQADGPTGLHYTGAELAIWRERAEFGPYRTPGDAGPGSPGDWQRIEANAQSFLDDPEAALWSGPEGDGCVNADANEPPTQASSELRDAAFTALVLSDKARAEVVRRLLVDQAGEGALQFRDESRWCTGVLYDGHPSFTMAHWLTKLLFAYDYLGEQGWQAGERERLDDWFSAAAEFMAADIDTALEGNFKDRAGGDLSASADRLDDPGCDQVPYFDGPPICATPRHYNNRRAAQARFVGLLGIHKDDEELKETASRFVREFVELSVYPEGFVGDFERWSDDLPDLGWVYGVNVTAAALTIADHFARAGDDSLYRFTTQGGDWGTEGGQRNLFFAATSLLGYIDGTVDRYATDDASDAGDPERRIDGVHEPAGWRSSHDVSLAPANLYFHSERIRGAYTRTGAGMPAHPSTPAPNGPHEVWTGEGGIYPGVLFMSGGLEGLVMPYPGGVGGEPTAEVSEARPSPSPHAGGGTPDPAGMLTDGSLSIHVSGSEDLADHEPLDGQTVQGDIYVFLDVSEQEAETRGIRMVEWHLDGASHHTEDDHPYYLEGGYVSVVRANPFDTTALSPGRHTLLVEVTEVGGTVRSAAVAFTVAEG